MKSISSNNITTAALNVNTETIINISGTKDIEVNVVVFGMAGMGMYRHEAVKVGRLNHLAKPEDLLVDRALAGFA